MGGGRANRKIALKFWLQDLDVSKPESRVTMGDSDGVEPWDLLGMLEDKPMEVDLLGLLEQSSQPVAGMAPAVHMDRDDRLALDVVEPCSNIDILQENTSLDRGIERQGLVVPSMKGKVGQGRHGGVFEKGMLTLHMRHAKMLKHNHDFRSRVGDLLQDSCFTKQGKLITVTAKTTSTGIVLSLEYRSTKGNRYQRAIPWATFLHSAYSQLRRSSHIAIATGSSHRSVKFMTTLVGQVFMNQQSVVLAKLISLAASEQLVVFIRQIKWDETQLLCSVNADKSNTAGSRVQSTWQVMAVRQRILLVFPNGQSLVYRLVMPPIVLLASGAEHIYYGLRHHPVFSQVNQLLELLAKRASHRICIWESDGAYSNERLMGHVFHKEKSANTNHFNLHCKCQNHQTQLVNVALLACVGKDLLGRLYGMTVFVRNLGYWLRLRQALAEWISEKLEFRQELHSSDLKGQVLNSPALLELIDFIRTSRDMEDKEAHQSFDRKVNAFLEMWNGDTSKVTPVHICSHCALPSHERHCCDRADAVNKCTTAFLDLFIVLPSVPAPNKWTTMFGCLDFVLTGIVIHKWLPEVFRRAFRGMKFAEFEQGMGSTDPKLIETLCFHAVNGRRHDSTLEFLTSDSSMWALLLLALAMEGSRALTWYWLSCLGTLLMSRISFAKIKHLYQYRVTQCLFRSLVEKEHHQL